NDLVHAQFVGETHGHDVARKLEPPSQRGHTEEVSLLEILRAPNADPRPLVEFERSVEDLRDRGVAVVERGRVDERLERGAGLTHRLHGAIELAGGVAESSG